MLIFLLCVVPVISYHLVFRLSRRLPSARVFQDSSLDVGAEDEPTSSSSTAVPGLVPLTYAVTSAVALACVPLIAHLST